MEYEAFLLDLIGTLVQDRERLQARLGELEARLKREVDYLRGEMRAERDLRNLTGESSAMKGVRHAINQVAGTDSTVLILGETGTGKELVARGIHQLSARRDHLMVSVNCAALNPAVLSSELFGHESGSFTGATKRRIGRFELAHRGTLFLDEIGEISSDTQIMLLRVLQERTIERVGGNQPVPVDVRLIAATHQDLLELVKIGRFRADLYYRLNVFPIRVPSLRERSDDIPDLVQHFIHQFNRRMNKQVPGASAEMIGVLKRYPWPGNVRELENIVERAMISAADGPLQVDANWFTSPGQPVPVNADQGLHDSERRLIQDTLKRCGGKIYGPGGAAELLRIKPTTLYGKMRKLGIERILPPTKPE